MTFQILTSWLSFGIRQEVVEKNEMSSMNITANYEHQLPETSSQFFLSLLPLCPHPSPLFFSKFRTGLGTDTSLYDINQCISKSELVTFGRYPNQTWAVNRPHNRWTQYEQRYQRFECPPEVLVVYYHYLKAVICT